MEASGSGQAANKVNLDLRGQRFALEREALMELPESVLLCLFPNGVVLSRQGHGAEGGGQDEGEEEEEEVFYVDFDGPCLSYILAFFLKARVDYYGTTAIIVLREELEYFVIPPTVEGKPPVGTDSDGIPTDDLLELKRRCGHALLERKSIFTALQRNVNRENNVAEQHLIDMLCMSGFNRDDDWGYRSLEPNRSCITSIALVLLKTGIAHHPPAAAAAASSDASTAATPVPTGPDPNVKTPPRVDANQLATAQKLLLFWRKPARKCWWDATDISISVPPDSVDAETKIWSRRVWTLELSLI